MNFDYVPQVKDDEGKPVFAGHVVIDVPNEFERIDIAKSMNFANGNTKEPTTDESLELTLKMKKLAYDKIKEVHLTAGGVKIDSVKMLNFYSEGSALINEIGSVCISGIKLGNVLQRQ